MPRIGSCLSFVCLQLAANTLPAPRCACGNGGPFFRGCSTGHLPRTTLEPVGPMLGGCGADPFPMRIKDDWQPERDGDIQFSQSYKVSGSQLREAPIIHLCLGFVLRVRHVIHRAGRAFVSFGRDADDLRRGCCSVKLKTDQKCSMFWLATKAARASRMASRKMGRRKVRPKFLIVSLPKCLCALQRNA